MSSLDDDNITIFSTDIAFEKYTTRLNCFCNIYDYELLIAFVEATECQEAIKELDDFTKEWKFSVLSDLDLLCEDGELRNPKDFLPGTHKLVIKYVGGKCTLKTKEMVQNIVCEHFHLNKRSIFFKGAQVGSVNFI